MKHSFDEKISYLLDEIGGVDDAMLTEAMSYRPAKKSGNLLRTFAAIACAVLVSVTGFSAVLINWSGWFVGEWGGNASDEGAPSWNAYTLDALLQDAKRGADYTLLSSVREVSYFGDAHLLWQYVGDDVVYQSRALTERELERLCALIDDGKSVGESAPLQFARVWLVLGNGDVLTPYLPATPGNVSSAIFDYNAEILPSKALIDCISDILKP
jgi:hypothetical protein